VDEIATKQPAILLVTQSIRRFFKLLSSATHSCQSVFQHSRSANAKRTWHRLVVLISNTMHSWTSAYLREHMWESTGKSKYLQIIKRERWKRRSVEGRGIFNARRMGTKRSIVWEHKAILQETTTHNCNNFHHTRDQNIRQTQSKTNKTMGRQQ
jgi:hypothetical protein